MHYLQLFDPHTEAFKGPLPQMYSYARCNRTPKIENNVSSHSLQRRSREVTGDHFVFPTEQDTPYNFLPNAIDAGKHGRNLPQSKILHDRKV
jgi:hypothetical protein